MGTIIKRKITDNEQGYKCKKCGKEATHMLDVTDNVGKIMSMPYCDKCITLVMVRV